MDLYTARRIARKRNRVSRTSDRDSFSMGGGLNLVDSPLAIKPGQVLACENYEIGIQGGYERVGGFERFDGQDAPSDESYYVLPFRYNEPLEPHLKVGDKFYNGQNDEIGTILDIVYLTDGGFNTMTRPELFILDGTGSGGSGMFKALAPDIDPPAQRKFSVQPTGTTTTTNVPRANSRDTAPLRAYALTASGANSTIHFMNFFVYWQRSGDSWLTGERLLFTCFVKPGDVRYVHIEIHDDDDILSSNEVTTFASGAQSATYDIKDGVVVSSNGAEASFESVDYGNGWRRLIFKSEVITSDLPEGVVRLYGFESSDLSAWSGGDDPSFYGAGRMAEVSEDPKVIPYVNSGTSVQVDPPTELFWGGVGYLVYRKPVNDMYPTNVLQDDIRDADNVERAFASGLPVERNAPTLADHLRYLSEAADAQRENIEVVPGGGPIRGVWFYGGVVYAFRDDAATSPTKCAIYKSTTSGWTEVTFSNHIDFDAGATEITEGQTITGATSGASAEVKRVNVINDDWGGSSAIGTLVLGSITGGPFQDDENLQVSAATVAVADGADYVPELSAGGTFEFRTYNFFGASDKRRMYGVNGQDRFFEYDDDDEILASYRTGMATDTPNRIATHLYMLFLMFPGGSVQNSGIGKPASWTVVTGASEIAVGDDGTGFLEEVGDSLFVFTRDQKYRLTGRTAANFALDRFDPNNGAIPWSIQRIGFGIHLDDRGFGSLSTSDRFGNYEANVFSRLIQPLVERKLKSSAVTASVIYRRRNRYRCFFDDGSFISIGVSGAAGQTTEGSVRISGHMTCGYGLIVRCACSREDTDGSERLFFGSDDGYIYEAEKGTSFDGKLIRSGLRLAYHHSGAPDRNKTYRQGRIEAVLDGQATMFVTPDISYGELVLGERDITATVGGAIFDHAMGWEGFIWDKRIEPLKAFTIDATGTNIGLSLRHESAVENPHTLRAMIYQTTMRNINRSAEVG